VVPSIASARQHPSPLHSLWRAHRREAGTHDGNKKDEQRNHFGVAQAHVLQRKEAGRLRALRLRRVRHARRYAIRDHEPDPGPRRNYPDRRVMVVMKKFLLATAILAASPAT
jgi:hypothetical protein